LGLDIGCGNGKYLTVNKEVFMIGSDRSSALINIARRHQPHSAVVGDILKLPHPPGVFDFAISIAVIHHLSTKERRVLAVREILATLRKSGQALVFVWALEQKGSRRGWDKGGEQDVLVPWVLKQDAKTKGERKAWDPWPAAPTTYQRYYHLYHEGELQEDVIAAGGIVVRSGYDRDNWWAEISRKPDRWSNSQVSNGV
jgi:tRNA (uracil-5-)-methyltransferase TRM9